MNSFNYETYTLNDVVKIIGGGTPKRRVQEYWNGDIPWISIEDFNDENNKKIYKTKESITKLGLEKSSTKILDTGNLIISARGTVGCLGQLSKPMAFNQSCYGLQPNKRLINNDFFYYSLKREIKKFKKISHGAVFNTITKDTFNNISINIPSLSIQKKIAHILSTLDDKIELNTKMNKTLEEIAQTIFKSWFVDYEPVYAKINARSENDLDKAAKDLNITPEMLNKFPKEFEESDLGLIPKGWEVIKLGNKLNILLGGTPSRNNHSFWTNGTVPWVNSGEINQFRIISGSEMITKDAVKQSSTKLLPKKTTLIAITGATLGQVSLLEIDSCANQSVIGIPETDEISYTFIYLSICNSIRTIISNQTGGAQQHINKGNIENHQILLPSSEVLHAFKKITESIFSLVSKNCFMIKNLKNTQDLLLAKLLSGDLDVSNLDMKCIDD